MFSLIASLMVQATVYCDVALFGTCIPRPVAVQCSSTQHTGCVRLPKGTVNITVEENQILYIGQLGLVIDSVAGDQKNNFLAIIGDAKYVKLNNGLTISIIR
jgi:hypothetical protein